MAESRIEELRRMVEGGPPDAAMLGRLLDALGDERWLVRKYASRTIAERFGGKAVEKLARVLSSGNEDQRYWAVQTLVAIGKASVPLLIRALCKGGKQMRIYAASALGDIADKRAIPYLVEALSDPVWRVRKNAYQALVTFGAVALPFLEKAVKSDDEDMAYWAAKALGKLGEASRGILLEALKEGNDAHRFVIAAALGESGDLRVVKVLINSCGDSSWIVCKRSAEALGEIGARAAGLVVDALPSAEGRKLYWLLFALCRMGEGGMAALVERLVNGGEGLRWACRESLVELGEMACPVLEALARCDSKDVRLFAASCLAGLGAMPGGDDLLVDMLGDESWSVRKMAADALSVRGARVLGRLEEALEKGDEDVKYWAAYALRKMGADGVPSLMKALDDSNRNIAYFAASALGDFRDRMVVKPLVRALSNRSWPVRKSAAESLKRLGALAVEELVRRLGDEDEHVSFWVRKILADVGAEGLDIITGMLRRGNEEEKIYAARALGILKDVRAVDALAEALASGSEWVRLYAAMALGEIGDPRGLDHLIQALGGGGLPLHPAVMDVFGKFRTLAVPALTALLEDKEAPAAGRAAAARVLGHLKAREAVPALLSILGGGRRRGRGRTRGRAGEDSLVRAALDALSSFEGDEEVSARLRELYDASVSASRRAELVACAARLGADWALERGVDLIQESVPESARLSLLDALSSMVERRGEEALNRMIAMLADDSVSRRRSAAEVLLHMGEGVKEKLEERLKDPDVNVRFWLSRVLKALRECRREL